MRDGTYRIYKNGNPVAELLYRLGKLAARRAWIVIVAWAAILGLAGGAFALGFTALGNSFDIPGTASSKVIAELEKELPDFAGASGTVVFHTDDDTALTAKQKSAISALVTDADLPDVTTVVDPFATEQQRADQAAQLADGQAQLATAREQLEAGQAQIDAAVASGVPAEALADQQAQIDSGLAELKPSETQAKLGAAILKDADGIRFVSDDGSTALVTIAFDKTRLELSEESKQAVVDYFTTTPIKGVSVDFDTNIAQGVPQVFGVGEVAGLLIAAIVLIVMLGTAIAASLPIVTAIVGVGVGVLSTLAFSGVVQMASVTPVLGVMLGLAVGIDYALFIVNRHRKQLKQGAELRESIGLANGTAGNAVLFAGSTVIVALLALNITGIPFLGLMGTVGAVCVFVAVLLAITLTPALLGLAGMRVLRKRDLAAIGKPVAGRPARAMSTARAAITIVLAIAALLTVASPALSMRLGLPDGGSEPAESTTHEAYEIVADKFGEGSNSTLLVTAELPAGTAEEDVLQLQADVTKTISGLTDVTSVAPIAVSDNRSIAAFQVIPAEGPNAESTEALVRELRELPPVNGDMPLGVAGQAAINIDISENLAAVLPLYLTVVVGLSLIIMVVVFRSLLVPLIATGGFIVSLFATFGAIVAVFQWGWFGIVTPSPILSFLPVILTGILFGLAMDYQLFLATGMREAFVHGSPARLAVAQGFRAGRSVVVAAGLIMVAVFGGFIFSESTIIRSMGFGLAVGVLVDAFVVRMLLMPALMHLLGRSAWWLPRWLDKLLPNVDVEGAALERRHHV